MCMDEIAPMDGADWRARALAGGEPARRAFAELWAAYYRKMTFLARGYGAIGTAGAPDAAQEILIRAFLKAAAYDPRRPLGPWLYRLGANYCAGQLRKRRREERALVRSYEPGTAEPGPETDFTVRDTARSLRAALDKLAGSDRTIALMVWIDGLSSKDAGRALGLPAGTVRYRLSRLRATLWAAGEEDHG